MTMGSDRRDQKRIVKREGGNDITHVEFGPRKRH